MLLRDYARIERAIEYLERHSREQPRLRDVARAAGVSAFHFQRLFRRWAGVSPKRFLQCLTVEHAKQALRQGRSVLHAAYDAGLSGPGRLHDHFVTVEGVTPGEFAAQGRDLTVVWGVHPTPFGYCFLAGTPRGICALEFLEDGDPSDALERLADGWPAARLRPDREQTAEHVRRIFGAATRPGEAPLTLAVRGTNFQIQVWRALLAIPPGVLASYGDIADMIGRPGAERAVGQAIARNPAAFVIPCHRAIRKTGALGGYRWGAARKQAILAWEAVRAPAAAGGGRAP